MPSIIQESICQTKMMIAPTKEPINHFFIIVDFGLKIKGKNLFQCLQEIFCRSAKLGEERLSFN
jgi:hypothetical protein